MKDYLVIVYKANGEHESYYFNSPSKAISFISEIAKQGKKYLVYECKCIVDQS
jgi:hypothetical protein